MKKQKSKFTYKFHDMIEGTPCAAMYIIALADQINTYPNMRKRGYFTYDGAYKAVGAYHKGELVGTIIINYPESLTGAFVVMSYTEPAYRKQGINTELFNRLIKYLQKEKCPYLDSITSVNNTAMQKQMERQGRPVIGTYHTYFIEQPPKKRSKGQ